MNPKFSNAMGIVALIIGFGLAGIAGTACGQGRPAGENAAMNERKDRLDAIAIARVTAVWNANSGQPPNPICFWSRATSIGQW